MARRTAALACASAVANARSRSRSPRMYCRSLFIPSLRKRKGARFLSEAGPSISHSLGSKLTVLSSETRRPRSERHSPRPRGPSSHVMAAIVPKACSLPVGQASGLSTLLPPDSSCALWAAPAYSSASFRVYLNTTHDASQVNFGPRLPGIGNKRRPSSDRRTRDEGGWGRDKGRTKELQRDLNRSSRHITKEKHDAQTR